MNRRADAKPVPGEGIVRVPLWKLLLLLPILAALAIPTFLYGARVGGNILPSVENFFYKMSDAAPDATPTPLPSFSPLLPQPGSILYTVQEGDSCVSILAFQMRMNDAGEVFSDVKPETVKALNKAIGKDCHAIQPGMVLPLSPQYPLVTIAGEVLKIDATTPQKVIPTPLIKVTRDTQSSVDCADGCLLTVRIAPQVTIRLIVETTLPMHIGGWIWAQAMFPRKAIPGFDTYPYADPHLTSLDGATLHACDFQLDNTHDANSLSCDQIKPNTIDDDRGSWLLGVTGPSGLDHWRYPLHLAAGTRVLLWLSLDNGDLKFHPGNPLYRYDEATKLYVKV